MLGPVHESRSYTPYNTGTPALRLFALGIFPFLLSCHLTSTPFNFLDLGYYFLVTLAPIFCIYPFDAGRSFLFRFKLASLVSYCPLRLALLDLAAESAIALGYNEHWCSMALFASRGSRRQNQSLKLLTTLVEFRRSSRMVVASSSIRR